MNDQINAALALLRDYKIDDLRIQIISEGRTATESAAGFDGEAELSVRFRVPVPPKERS